ncbi:MAG: DUF1016 family protein [Paludibacteraceae bacterium]|nr:DUF1016 family protein [Paludibacteraceae bacterium]
MTFESLARNIESIQSALQQQAAHAVNLSLTARNWLVGWYIVEYEQNGEDRAKYGTQLLKRLEERLHTKGLTERRFREFRRLYLVYPQLGHEVLNYVGAQISTSRLALPETIRRTSSADSEDTAIRRSATAESENAVIRRSATAELGQQTWQVPADRLFLCVPTTHLIAISQIDDPLKRAFYEIETIKGCWTMKELDRQISTLYYERSGLSKDKIGLSKLVNQTAQSLSPRDVLHNPVALEFLDLEQNEKIDETDIETAILDKMQAMLMELGNGFCFEARQKRILIDGDYYKIDLVFYHRVLKCHFLVELKIDKFRHEYASQLNMYLNYFKHEVMLADDNPPIGLLLCADYGETVVKYATGGLDPNLFVQKYHITLPTEEEIKAFIAQSIKVTK